MRISEVRSQIHIHYIRNSCQSEEKKDLWSWISASPIRRWWVPPPPLWDGCGAGGASSLALSLVRSWFLVETGPYIHIQMSFVLAFSVWKLDMDPREEELLLFHFIKMAVGSEKMILHRNDSEKAAEWSQPPPEWQPVSPGLIESHIGIKKEKGIDI